MSLSVSPQLQARAQDGPVSTAEFIDCVASSLPYAYTLIAGLAGRLATGGRGEGGQGFVDNQTPPPDEAARGQLLRALASTSIRTALEEHFGVRLAFQNCHRVAVFTPDATAGSQFDEFISPRAQLLNQTPDLVNC